MSKSFTVLPTGSHSPPREETKITLGHDGGETVIAVSKRQRLYHTLKRVSAIVTIEEDEVRLQSRLQCVS